MNKKTKDKKITVFLYPPDNDAGDPPWWARVEARGFKSAFRSAVKLCTADAVKAGIFDEEDKPGIDEFQFVAAFEGWGAFVLEV